MELKYPDLCVLSVLKKQSYKNPRVILPCAVINYPGHRQNIIRHLAWKCDILTNHWKACGVGLKWKSLSSGNNEYAQIFMSICWDVIPWAKVLGKQIDRQMDRLTNAVMTSRAKMMKVCWHTSLFGENEWTAQWNHMPLGDHSIPRHSTAKTWLRSPLQVMAKTKAP